MHALRGWKFEVFTGTAITWLGPLCSFVIVADSIALLATCLYADPLPHRSRWVGPSNNDTVVPAAGTRAAARRGWPVESPLIKGSEPARSSAHSGVPPSTSMPK